MALVRQGELNSMENRLSVIAHRRAFLRTQPNNDKLLRSAHGMPCFNARSTQPGVPNRCELGARKTLNQVPVKKERSTKPSVLSLPPEHLNPDQNVSHVVMGDRCKWRLSPVCFSACHRHDGLWHLCRPFSLLCNGGLPDVTYRDCSYSSTRPVGDSVCSHRLRAPVGRWKYSSLCPSRLRAIVAFGSATLLLQWSIGWVES
jgi:hypothetical protein